MTLTEEQIAEGLKMDSVLFTHGHLSWRKHEIPNGDHDGILLALDETHGFLADYRGLYRVQIERTPALSFDGIVLVFWDSDTPHAVFAAPPLRKGDFWFRAFEFNVAPQDACIKCGGTGIDHYSGPFFHCWACDGTTKQLRTTIPPNFKKKRVCSSRASNTRAQQ